jgi:8-oxo-dGTP diphosphatase
MRSRSGHARGCAETRVWPRVGVGVLVIDDAGRVLMSLRRRPPEAGTWSILGGKLELFEHLETCATREVREEAGIDIRIERLLCVTDHLIGTRQHWVAPAYLARIAAGVPRNLEPQSASDLRWFRLTKLPKPLSIPARAAIDAYTRSCTDRRRMDA